MKVPSTWGARIRPPAMLRDLSARMVQGFADRVAAIERTPEVRRRLADQIDLQWAVPRGDSSFMLRAIADLAPGRVLIYGGGTHTDELLAHLSQRSDITVGGIVDQRGAIAGERFGLPGFMPDQLSAVSFDYVLLSHQEYELQMLRRLKAAGLEDHQIVGLYAGRRLPPSATIPTDDVTKFRTLIVTFNHPTNQIILDEELAERLPPEQTAKLMMGRPSTARASAVFPSFDLQRSADRLAGFIRASDPELIYLMTTFQNASASWGAWIAERFPTLPVIHELYDWGFTLPDRLLKGQFLYDDQDLADELLAEAAVPSQAKAIVHKYGGPFWRGIDHQLGSRASQTFPVIRGARVTRAHRVSTAEKPVRIVFCGSIPPPAQVDAFAPEYRVVDWAETLATSPDVTVDIYNNIDRTPADAQVYQPYAARCEGTRVNYRRSVSMQEMDTLLEGYDIGLLALDFTGVEARFMDIVCVGNKFASYTNAGLPVICSLDDIFTAALVRRFNAGIVIALDQLARLSTELPSLNLAQFRAGAARLHDYMYAVNQRSSDRINHAVEAARQGRRG